MDKILYVIASIGSKTIVIFWKKRNEPVNSSILHPEKRHKKESRGIECRKKKQIRMQKMIGFGYFISTRRTR
jgi:hypothetical protein